MRAARTGRWAGARGAGLAARRSAAGFMRGTVPRRCRLVTREITNWSNFTEG